MSDPKITFSQVRHVAELARLSVPEAQLETMRAELDTILGYMAELDAVDVEGVEPSYHAVVAEAPLRPDLVRSSLLREESLAQAPHVVEGGFAVPRVIEEQE